MNRSPKRRKKKGERPGPTAMTWSDKLQICLWIAGILGFVGFGLHFIAIRRQSDRMDVQMARWQNDYHLTGEQIRRIRAIEEDYHGRGNPFLMPTHDAAEKREHHRAIAREMNPDDGARFFRAQEGSELPH